MTVPDSHKIHACAEKIRRLANRPKKAAAKAGSERGRGRGRRGRGGRGRGRGKTPAPGGTEEEPARKKQKTAERKGGRVLLIMSGVHMYIHT